MRALERVFLWVLILILSYNVFGNTENIIMKKVQHKLGFVWDAIDNMDTAQGERIDDLEKRVWSIEYDRDHNVVPSHRHQSVVDIEDKADDLESRISELEDR